MGVIRADSETQLVARVPARILSVAVREGDWVRRGQLLARLDDRDARATLKAAEAGVIAAEAALAKSRRAVGIRSAELSAGVSTAEAAVEAARSRLTQARGEARAAQAAATAEQRRATAALESAQASLAAATRGGRPAHLRQAEAALAQAEAAARAAQRGLQSSQFLYDRGGLTRSKLDEARTADETARAQVEAARAALEQARQGASPEERRAAEAAVRQAQAGVEAARAGAHRARLGSEDAAAAAAQLRQAKAALQAARAGTAGSAVVREDVRAAEASLAQARVQHEQARERLAATRLVSPDNGVIIFRAADPGQFAQPGQPLLTLASGSLWLEAPITADVVRALRPGQSATLTSESAPGRTFRAILRDVPPVPGPDGRTYTVRAAISSSRLDAERRGSGQNTKHRTPARGRPRFDTFLAPGVRARGSVQVAFVPDAVLVPPEAIHRLPEGPIVWVARSSGAQRRPVGLGLQTETSVQILSGLTAGESVIVSGATDLRPGAPIDPVEESSRTDPPGPAWHAYHAIAHRSPIAKRRTVPSVLPGAPLSWA